MLMILVLGIIMAIIFDRAIIAMMIVVVVHETIITAIACPMGWMTRQAVNLVVPVRVAGRPFARNKTRMLVLIVGGAIIEVVRIPAVSIVPVRDAGLARNMALMLIVGIL